MDLSRLNINLEHASFIDLDVSQDLCLEIKFNQQRVANTVQDLENLFHRALHRGGYYESLQWH